MFDYLLAEIVKLQLDKLEMIIANFEGRKG